MDREGIGAISRDRLEDGISALGPDERLGIGIVGLNESGDVGLEVLDTAMDAALDLLVGEPREPAFDLIEPGGAGFAVGTPITGCHRVTGGSRPPPVPTERGVRIYRTALFDRCFTALRAPAAPGKGGAV